MLKKLKYLALLAVPALLSATADGAQAQAPSRLTIASGPISGAFYPMAGVLGKLIEEANPGTTVTVTTGGGVENLPKVAAGMADLGFTQADIYASAINATAPYDKGIPGTSALGYLGFVPQAFFLVKEGSEYTSIEDLIAKKQKIRLVLPPRNNGGELIVQRLLAQLGASYADIDAWGGSVAFMGYSEASGLIADGHADAYVGPVIGAIQEMITQTKMRLLPWPEAAIDGILDQGYEKRTMPAERYYFMTAATPMPALKNIIVVPEKMDAAFVSSLAEILVKHEKDIQQSASMFQTYAAANLAKVTGGPLHPGAASYYKSQGIE